jgi:hypothetical protein
VNPDRRRVVSLAIAHPCSDGRPAGRGHLRLQRPDRDRKLRRRWDVAGGVRIPKRRLEPI